jgi:hypothetical protein
MRRLLCSVLLTALLVGCGASVLPPERERAVTAEGDWWVDPRAEGLGVTIERAACPDGCWRLVSARFEDETQSGGTHHIYIEEPHDLNLFAAVSNGVETWLVLLEKPPNEPAGNHAMAAGNVYSAQMRGAASDSIHGMRMRGPDADSEWQAHHVSWHLTFEWQARAPPEHQLYLQPVWRLQ